MSKKWWLLPLAAGMMAVSPLVVGQDQARQQVQDQDRIFGSQLMAQEERMAYSSRMRAAKTQEERERIRAEHHEQMKMRAKERGVTLPDEPPARGGGMGGSPRGRY